MRDRGPVSPTRILFVDDDRNVLSGIQNLLRRDRKRWDMTFAEGGDAALAVMERAPCDVVVSDMRMPGMDGAALLTLIKHKYPNVVRVEP